jgi:hypothetical protein
LDEKIIILYKEVFPNFSFGKAALDLERGGVSKLQI